MRLAAILRAPPRAIEHDSGVSYTACSFFYMHDPICSPFIISRVV